jgi:hypothetical protein
MTAAMVVGAPSGEPSLDREEVARELSQLHIILLGVRADTEDVLSPARPQGSGGDLKRGVAKAIARLQTLRERLQEG